MILLIDPSKRFTSHKEYVQARTYSDAIDLLRDGQSYDETWFEYNLEDGTAEPVLDYIEALHADGASPDLGTVFIHTSSSEGRRTITNSLKSCGYHPVSVNANLFLEEA